MELSVDVIKTIETRILSGPEQKYVVFPLVQELVSSGWDLAQIAFGRSELVLPSKGRPDICVFGSREGATACDLSDVRFVIECKTPRGGEGVRQLAEYLTCLPAGVPGVLARSASLRSSAAVVAMSGDKTFGLEWVVLGDAGFVFTPPGGNAPRIPPLEQGREDSLPDVPSDEGDLISLPSLLCLSDLFRPGNRTDERAVFSDKPLCTGGASYSGPELRQDDLVNLSQIIGYADGAPEGSSLTFSGYAFLRDASAAAMKPGGASTSSGRYEDLRASLARLSTASLSFSGVEGCQGFPLLEHFESGPSAQRGKANRITVRVSPGVMGLFKKGAATVDKRMHLSLSPMGRWLNLFFASLPPGARPDSESIRKSCGSRMAPAQFKSKLAKTWLPALGRAL